LYDLSTIENEIAQIIRPTKKDKQKAKSYKDKLRETIAQFGDFRDNQLQIE
jgi:tRNA nucleotidyltransferase (CCA-adding enzyme)